MWAILGVSPVAVVVNYKTLADGKPAVLTADPEMKRIEDLTREAIGFLINAAIR